MMKMLTECLFVKIPEPDNDMLKSTREIMDGKEQDKKYLLVFF